MIYKMSAVVIIEKGRKLSNSPSSHINYEFEEKKDIKYFTCKVCGCKFIYKYFWELGIKGDIVPCPNNYCSHRTYIGLKKNQKSIFLKKDILKLFHIID